MSTSIVTYELSQKLKAPAHIILSPGLGGEWSTILLVKTELFQKYYGSFGILDELLTAHWGREMAHLRGYRTRKATTVDEAVLASNFLNRLHGLDTPCVEQVANNCVLLT